MLFPIFPRTWFLRTLLVLLLPAPLLLLVVLECIAGTPPVSTALHALLLMLLLLPAVVLYRRIEELAQSTEGPLRGLGWLMPQGGRVRGTFILGLIVVAAELVAVVNQTLPLYSPWIRGVLVAWTLSVGSAHLAVVCRHRQRRAALPHPDLWARARLNALQARLVTHLGSTRAARAWLLTPREELAGRSAFVAAWTEEGMRTVEALLEGIA